MIYAQLAAGLIIAAAIFALLAADLRLVLRQARWERRRDALVAERQAGYPSVFDSPAFEVE